MVSNKWEKRKVITLKIVYPAVNEELRDMWHRQLVRK
jgi:hypothetical protein